jgi:hypothetical protein
MPGHMRTFRQCAARARDKLLRPNNAALYIVSYMASGDKRPGRREQELVDDAVDWRAAAAAYAPHLAAALIVDGTALRAAVARAFPEQWDKPQQAWMLYQFALMEAAARMAAAAPGGFSPVSTVDLLGPTGGCGWHKAVPVGAVASIRSGWAPAGGVSPGVPYDVLIRMRPDLFVVGTLRIAAALPQPTSAPPAPATADTWTLALTCGGETDSSERTGAVIEVAATFGGAAVLVAPHHPVAEWVLDPVSDLVSVAAFTQGVAFSGIYTRLASQPEAAKRAVLFDPQATAERLWRQVAADLGLELRRGFGWFGILRNETTFQLGKDEGAASERRRQLVRRIFSIFDPASIPCPRADGSMDRLAPHRRRRRK